MEVTHAEVERRFRALVAEADLAEPDRVEYEAASVVFYWEESRLAVVVDLDEGDGRGPWKTPAPWRS